MIFFFLFFIFSATDALPPPAVSQSAVSLILYRMWGLDISVAPTNSISCGADKISSGIIQTARAQPCPIKPCSQGLHFP